MYVNWPIEVRNKQNQHVRQLCLSADVAVKARRMLPAVDSQILRHCRISHGEMLLEMFENPLFMLGLL
jgi:hypothetical protein